MNQKQKLKVPAIEVSIIIISYNVQKYLIQCIKSILHHTNKKFKYETDLEKMVGDIDKHLKYVPVLAEGKKLLGVVKVY